MACDSSITNIPSDHGLVNAAPFDRDHLREIAEAEGSDLHAFATS